MLREAISMCIYDSRPITQNVIDKFKPTRLAIKELNGKLYFCKSISKDIVAYTGSGTLWRRICKKYGKENIKTLWVSDWYFTPQEIQQVALHFSKENQIVESDKWANMKPEDGLDGGIQSDKTIQQIASKNTGQKRTPEQNEAKSKRQRGTKKSQEWLDKRVGSKYKKHKLEWEFIGEKHWNFDKTIYIFEHKDTGEILKTTKNDFRKKFPRSNLSALIRGKRPTTSGWKFLGKAT